MTWPNSWKYVSTSSCCSRDGASAVALLKLATMAATDIWREPSGKRQPGCRPKQAAWPYFPSLGQSEHRSRRPIRTQDQTANQNTGSDGQSEQRDRRPIRTQDQTTNQNTGGSQHRVSFSMLTLTTVLGCHGRHQRNDEERQVHVWKLKSTKTQMLTVSRAAEEERCCCCFLQQL